MWGSVLDREATALARWREGVLGGDPDRAARCSKLRAAAWGSASTWLRGGGGPTRNAEGGGHTCAARPRRRGHSSPRSHSTATWALGGPGLLGPLTPAPCPAPPATSDLSFQIFPRLASRAVDGPATPVKPWPCQRLWFLDASWGRVSSHEGERCPAHGRRPENICGGRGGAGF